MYERTEPILDRELSKKAKGLWLRAISAIEVKNHEYAVKLIHEILSEAPGFLEGRKTARRIAILEGGLGKRTTKTSALHLIGATRSDSSLVKIRATIPANPQQALLSTEVELSKDPASAVLNELLFGLSINLGMPETAAFALETLREQGTASAAVLLKLADHYMSLQRGKEAIEIYDEILAKDSSNFDALEKKKVAEKSLKQETVSNVAVVTAAPAASQAEQNPILKVDIGEIRSWDRDQKRDHLQSLMVLYQEDNRNLTVINKIAQIYGEMGHYNDACIFYSWAYELSPNEVNYKTQAWLMVKKRDEKRYYELEQMLLNNPDDEEARQQFKKAKINRCERIVKELTPEIKRYPSDTDLRYKVAEALVAIGEYTEAIKHLQIAVRDAQIRTHSLLLLAKAFSMKGAYDLAIRQLDIALGDLPVMSDEKKEVLYQQARNYAKLELHEKANQLYKRIHDVDSNFRDVVAKVKVEKSDFAQPA